MTVHAAETRSFQLPAWPSELLQPLQAVRARLLRHDLREMSHTGPAGDGRTPFLDAFEDHPEEPYATCLAEGIVRSWLESEPVIRPGEILVGTPRPVRPIREHFSFGLQFDLRILDQPAYAAQAPEFRARFGRLRARLTPQGMDVVEAEGIRRFGSPEAWAATRSLMWVAGYQGHTVPDYAKLLRLGIGGLVQEIARNRAAHDDPRAHTLLDACEHVYRGMSQWILHYADAAQPDSELGRLCSRVAWAAPTSLREAAQLLWFYCLWDSVDSLGRCDQYLYPFLLRDRAAGRGDDQAAFAVICDLWMKFLEHGVHNVTLGGQTETGGDATNDLTWMALAASRVLHETHPRLTVRVHQGSPPGLLERCLVMWSEGMADPSFANDELIIPGLVGLGIPVEEARDYTCLGCQEIEIPGRSNWGSEDGSFNLAKCLELALNNGRCRRTGIHLGPITGDPQHFTGIEDVWQAFRLQVESLVRHCVELSNIGAGLRSANLAKLVRMPLTADCLERGLDPDGGGAHYGFGMLETVGIGAVADSLSAIEKLVFTDRTLDLGGLLDALAADYAGHEPMRQRLLHDGPKHGDDDAAADRWAQRVAGFFWEHIRQYTSGRGGPYLGAVSLLTGGIAFGQGLAAMPDGCRAGSPLGNSVGPRTGANSHGPTAMLRSAARVPQHLALGGATTNLKLPATLLRTPEQRRNALALVLGYFHEGGQMVQITPVDTETLRAARREPGLHRDLIVRVGGYSAKFVKLGQEVQDDIIARNG